MPDAAGHWLGAIRSLVHAAAHEIRNPLNGAALNVEALVSRSRRKDVPAEALAGFAAAAAADLRNSISLVNALLSLSRSLPAPAQLSVALEPVAVLLRAVTEAKGGSLEVSLPDELAASVRASGDEVRGVLSAALLPAALAGAAMQCRVVYEPLEVIVSIEMEMTPANAPNDGVLAGMAACGIGMELEPYAMRLRFPRSETETR